MIERLGYWMVEWSGYLFFQDVMAAYLAISTLCLGVNFLARPFRPFSLLTGLKH
jgi:hypothetical protein